MGDGIVLKTSEHKEKNARNIKRYNVTLTNDEIQELKALVQKGGKRY